MFIASNFISAAAHIVNILLTALYWLVLIRALLSWVSPDPFNPIVMFINKVTDPILEPIRKIVPQIGPFDISPIIAFLLIMFAKYFIVNTLFDFAIKLR